MFDLITVGDITLDVFLELDEATVQCDLDKDQCKICVNYADKIPVKKMTKVNAVGNAANVAVGGSRLGMKSAVYTHIGDDDSGEEMRQHLKSEQVSLDYVVTDQGTVSNYSTVLNYKGERTIFVYKVDREYALPKTIEKSAWMYYTAVAEDHDDLNLEIADYIKRDGVKLAFNPGTHQLRAGAKSLSSLLSVCEILFVNKQEAQQIVGQENDIGNLASQLHEMGVKIVCITDGQNGSYTYDGEHLYHLDILPAPVIERTGAGDSFATGFVAAQFHGMSIEDSMKWGNANAASVIQCIGAQEGLLTKEAIQEALDAHPNYAAQIVQN